VKIVELEYMNDEQQPITVRVMDARYDASNCTGDIYTTLQACEHKEFEVHMPDDAILYIKKWKTLVMLSYREQTAPQPNVPPVELPQDALDALKDVFQE
jgi:hypothetical protein